MKHWKPLPPRNPATSAAPALGRIAVRQPKADWAFDKTQMSVAQAEHKPLRVNTYTQGDGIAREASPKVSDIRRSAPYVPKEQQPGYPAARSQGNRATGVQLLQSEKKMWKTWTPADGDNLVITDTGSRLARVLVEITLEDGSTKLIQPKIRTNTLHVTCYGKAFEMRKTNRGHTVFDGRSGKRVTQAFAKSELCRILDRAAGLQAFEALVAV